MTKHKFKQELEELLFAYFHHNRNKKDLPDSIDINYVRETPNKDSYGEIVFRTDERDVLLKIKAIDYKDEDLPS